MIEEEWMTATDPTPMLEFLRGKGNDRKFRLFGVACCRRIWHLFNRDEKRGLVEVAERHADLLATPHELVIARETTEGFFEEVKEGEHEYLDLTIGDLLEPLMTNRGGWRFPAAEVANSAASAAGGVLNERSEYDYESSHSQRKEERVKQCELVRDIFGNPFHPVHVDPAWLTPTVIQLAEHIYQERAFDQIPILADALQDAGCENAEILAHCRSGGPHVRGCFVVDLLLGKS